MSKTTTTRYDVAEHLRTPAEMAAYLEACFEEANGDAAFIAKALGDIARAKGMSQVARDAGLSRESLYKALSGERNPNFDTILKVIMALGLKLHAGSGLIDDMQNVLIENLNVASIHSTAIFDASHNGIVVIDRDGIVLVFNLAARRIFGETDRSFVGQHFSEIRPEAWPDLQKILKTGQPQIGKRIDLPQASIVVNRKPIVVGDEIVGVISVFQDISEYEKMITELQGFKELHGKLEAVIESSHDGLVLSDNNGVILMQNQSFERLTGLARKEMIGRRAKDLLQEGYVDQSITLEVLKLRRKVTALQTCKTGKQVMVTGNPIFDETGKIMLVVMNVRDLTELNHLRSQLQDSEQIRNRLHKSLSERDGKAKILNEMVVRSPAMMQVLDRATRVAGGGTPVFLQGPSGVGKSMLAKLIHQISPRREGPFIKINCGAIPEALLESELFGYEKGAFTGADPAGKAGLVEAGNGGTVLLDEVTEISPNLQVKLLEIIEEKTFTRVGGIGPKSVDVHIIAASNRDLKQMIQRGEFREDLYFRLNVFPIAIPPLCRRTEDIPALADHFITKLSHDRKLKKRLSREVIDRLKEYPFPGNIRELINILEQMVIMSDGERIGIGDIPAEVRTSDNRFTAFNSGDMSLKQAVEVLEERIIKETVHGCRDLTQAAKKLGISSSTLWRKMTRYAIKTHHSNLQ